MNEKYRLFIAFHCSMSYTSIFCQIKRLMYKIVVSFISVAFVVFNKFSNIFVAMQHPWNIPFLEGFLGLFSHKCGSSLLKFRLEVVSHKTKGVFEHSFKIKSLNGNGTYPQFTILVHLWAQFTHGKPKILPKTKSF